MSQNRVIPALLLGVSFAEAVVLAGVGVILFLAPSFAHRHWPWELTPFNTRFLGAVYLASLAAVAVLVAVARWSAARLVLPMVLAFTALVLVVSLAYAARFHWGRPGTWAWFFLYIALPLNSAYFLWRDRATEPLLRLRAATVAAAAPLAAYGVALLVAPRAATDFWPWPIDSFHGRLYSAAFATLATGLACLPRATPAAARVALGLASLVVGTLAPVGLAVVDADVHRVDWSRAGTIAWLAVFGAIAAVGAVLLCAPRRRPSLDAPSTA